MHKEFNYSRRILLNAPTRRLSLALLALLLSAGALPALIALGAEQNTLEAPAVEGNEDGAEFSGNACLEGRNDRRTYDALNADEERELQRLSNIYLEKVKDDSLPLVQVFFDANTILRSFPEQIRIVRQRRRPQLLDVEKYLYSLRLNSEFISNYVNRLERDSVYYALDALLKKSNGFVKLR